MLLPALHPYYMPGLDLDPRPLEVKKAVLRGTQRRLPVMQCWRRDCRPGAGLGPPEATSPRPLYPVLGPLDLEYRLTQL